MNNGRIDIAGKTNLDVFTLYDQIPTSDTTSDFREALTGTNSSTQLSHAYFSKENIQHLQNKIRQGVYEESNGQWKTGSQKSL